VKKLDPGVTPSLEQQKLFIAGVLMRGAHFTPYDYDTVADMYCEGWKWYISLGLIDVVWRDTGGPVFVVTEKGKELLK
jgi:hypothetical protein